MDFTPSEGQAAQDTMRAMPSGPARTAKLNPDVFHTYDIRGVYGVDFDDQFGRELANKIVTHYGAKTVLVARDGRASSEGLERLAVTGVTQAGADAISIGLSTTPLYYWSVISAKADLGIMITASHNPQQYNGFKVIKGDGTLVGGQELQHIFKEEYVQSNGTGTTMSMETRPQYLAQVVAVAGSERLDMPLSLNVPALMQEHIVALANQYGITSERNASLHIHMDPDADRIHFYENGIKIPSDFVCALVADILQAKTVVHDLRFSRSVLEYWKSKKVKTVSSRIGRLNIALNMRENDADVGGEISGHFYFKQFSYLEAPELVLLLVMRAVKVANATLMQLTSAYRKYYKSEEITLRNGERWMEFRERLKERYQDGTITEYDGVSIEYTEPDGTLSWWCNLRPSNTEPVMRLIVEAKTKDLLDEKVSEIRYLLQ